jgi:hypothetical protein
MIEEKDLPEIIPQPVMDQLNLLPRYQATIFIFPLIPPSTKRL